MKTLRKCIYLIFGLFLVGFVSCANDSSSSDINVSSRNTETDKSGLDYRDGFYEFDDGNTRIYLYYENRNLVSAGNNQGKLPSNEIEVLKQSYSWNTVSKYCTRYEVSLYSTKWMLGVYPAEKLFKKGWYDININQNAQYRGYYESYNSSMIFTYDWPFGTGSAFRTNNFDDNDSYSNKSWNLLLNDFVSTNYLNASFKLLSENLDYYPEQSSQSE